MLSTAHALHLDFETRSTVDLKKCGAYRYALDPTTDLWLACYAFDDGPVLDWYPGQPCPERIADHVRQGGKLFAWNTEFERIIWKCILTPRYRWPEPRLEQWEDPEVWALTMAFPGNLGFFGQAAGLGAQKDEAGRRLMLQMAKPRKIRDDGTIVWWDDPDKLRRLRDYCARDVESEREACLHLLPLSDAERAVWLADQRINDRGVKFDLPFVHAAKRVVAARVQKLDAALSRVTKGAVPAATNVPAIADWLVQRDFPMESIDKEAVIAALARTDLPDDVRAVLTLRQQAGKSSTGKLDTMELVACSDGRARGLFRFNKAATGRWAGSLVQLHNMPRGKKSHQKQFDDLCAAIATGNDDWVDLEFGDPLDAVSSSLRGCVIAAPGHKLVVRDFSSIEAVKLAWSAGEQWKLQAFREYNAGTGPDMYKLAYARTFGVPLELVDDSLRQVGKVLELAMGYQGGVGAFVTMAATVQLDIPALVATADPSLPAWAREKAAEAWEVRGSGLDQHSWIVLEALKCMWRAAHPATQQYWWDLEEAAISAVRRPGEIFRVPSCDIRYRMANGHLWCRLPSGRALCYPYPALRETKTPWDTLKTQLTYMGQDSMTKQWRRQSSYGGHLAENNTQAMSADYQRRALLECEKHRIPVVMHVHDEVVAEVPEDRAADTLEVMGHIMRTPPEWAADCPIASKGFITDRYRKD